MFLSKPLCQRDSRFGRIPIRGEAAADDAVHKDGPVDLVAGVLREFDAEVERIEIEGLDAGIEQRLAQTSALLGWPASANVADQDSAGHRLGLLATPNIALAEFAKADVDEIGRGLHDGAVEVAEPFCEIALYGEGVFGREVKLEMGHGVAPQCRTHVRRKCRHMGLIPYIDSVNIDIARY
jgi:hypothetical protein